MSNRYRWLRIKYPSAIQDVDKLFIEHPFGAGVPYGFSTIDNNEYSERYRFLWRTLITVTSLDDCGNPIYQEVDSVGFIDFSIIEANGEFFLRIMNPGRSIRDFLNALEDVFGFGFTVKPIEFDDKCLTGVFEKVDSFRLVGMKISGAVLGKDLVSRMEFASKNGIKVSDISFLDKIKYRVDFSTYEVIINGIKGGVAVSASGMVKISGYIDKKLLELIELGLLGSNSFGKRL